MGVTDPAQFAEPRANLLYEQAPAGAKAGSSPNAPEYVQRLNRPAWCGWRPPQGRGFPEHGGCCGPPACGAHEPRRPRREFLQALIETPRNRGPGAATGGAAFGRGLSTRHPLYGRDPGQQGSCTRWRRTGSSSWGAPAIRFKFPRCGREVRGSYDEGRGLRPRTHWRSSPTGAAGRWPNAGPVAGGDSPSAPPVGPCSRRPEGGPPASHRRGARPSTTLALTDAAPPGLSVAHRGRATPMRGGAAAGPCAAWVDTLSTGSRVAGAARARGHFFPRPPQRAARRGCWRSWPAAHERARRRGPPPPLRCGHRGTLDCYGRFMAGRNTSENRACS